MSSAVEELENARFRRVGMMGPTSYISLIFAVDAFLDMFRTSTNVLGDAVGAVVVNRLERSRLGAPAGA